MSIYCELIAGGCNTVYNGFDISKDSNFSTTVAYPCSNQILIYDTQLMKVICSLSCFQKRVNQVKLFTLDQKLNVVGVSGDGIIGIFELKEKWELVRDFKASKESLHSIQIIKTEQNGTFFVVLGIDASVTVYNSLLEIQTCINFSGANIMESIDAITFNNTNMVALSGVDSLIHLYEFTVDPSELKYLTSLKGHLRSVNSLSFKLIPGSVLLSSGGKDNYVRLWKLYQDQELNQDQDLQHKQGVKTFKLKNQEIWKVKLDSVLQGHAEEISSLEWGEEQGLNQDSPEVFLVSASFDYNIIIWKQDLESGLWLIVTRLGQTSGNKNQFFAVKTDYTNTLLIACTFVGAFFVWKKLSQEWKELPVITGHFSYVTDLDWSSQGYLVTCSQDQTTRIWGKWLNNSTWHELSRPQIHGYDLNAVKILRKNDGILETIVSGADEKVLRLFSPTPVAANFLNSLSNSQVTLPQKIQSHKQKQTFEGHEFEIDIYKLGLTSISQPLGLMNKQMDMPGLDEEFGESLDLQDEINPLLNISEINYDQPPSDSFLTIRGLWPELNKMYGHGYEVAALATYKTIVASSCKSTSLEAARIIIWDTENYKIKQQLPSHSFTVVQLQFSITGKWLASVSKDRCLSLFQKVEDQYQLQGKSQPCARIVYTCIFTDDENHVLTGSRDKKLRIYRTDNLQKVFEQNLGLPVTAIEFKQFDDRQMVIVGFENGEIHLFWLTQDNEGFHLKDFLKVDQSQQHNSKVNRISIQPNHEKVKQNDKLKFASCGDDHTLRIFNVHQ